MFPAVGLQGGRGCTRRCQAQTRTGPARCRSCSTRALGAAASLTNNAFEVKKTPSGGSEEAVSLSDSPSISGKHVDGDALERAGDRRRLGEGELRVGFTVVNGETLARAACLQDDAASGDSPVSIAVLMAFPMRSVAACRSRSPT